MSASASRGQLDAVEELRTAPLRPFHVGLVVVIMLATLFDGYDTLNPSYVIHFVAGPWGLTHSNTGFLVSSGLIGFLVGALVHGPVADRIGRRPVLLTALAGSGAFSLLTAALADGFGSFVALRFLTGMFLGVIMPLGTAYINEFTPARSANRVVVIAISGYCLGGVAASLVGIYLTPHHGWHILYWLGGASIVLAAAIVPFLPESVQFLVLHGDHAGIARTLSRIRPERATTYGGAVFAQPRRRATTKEMLGTLVSQDYLRTTVSLWVCAFMVLFCIYGLSGWLPDAMEERGNGFAASFAFLAILQLAGIVGGIVVGMVCDGGRLSPAAGIAVLLAIATVAVAVVGAGAGTSGDLVMVGVAGFGIIGGQAVLDTLAAQSYPAHLRGTATGAMFGVGRVGGILGPYLIGWILDWTDGRTWVVFLAIAVATALGALTMALLALVRGATRAPDIPIPAQAAAPEALTPESQSTPRLSTP